MQIDGNTQLLGLLGWPVSHSLSPAMHNAAAAELGLNVAYLPLAVSPDRLPDAVRGAAVLGFRGLNVTVPHKQAVMGLLDELTDDARTIGAVNTIVFEPDGPKVGHNTDWSGFLTDLETLDIHVDGRDCLVLGAGGSARGIVYALLNGSARVHVLARRAEQAEVLAADLSDTFPHQTPVMAGTLTDLAPTLTVLHAPLIVNTTPLGMSPNATTSPLPDDLPLPPESFGYDLVYNPAATRFMDQIVAGGNRAANGLGMLVQQAAASFTLWTSRQPDTETMRHAAETALIQTHTGEES